MKLLLSQLTVKQRALENLKENKKAKVIIELSTSKPIDLKQTE